MSVDATRSYPDIPFDALRDGDVFRARYEVSPQLVADFDAIVGPRAVDPACCPVAPPWVFCTFRPMFEAMAGRMAQGSIHTRQAVQFHRPVAVGARLDVVVTVERAAVRDGRQRVVVVTDYREHDRPVCTATATYLWGWAAP